MRSKTIDKYADTKYIIYIIKQQINHLEVMVMYSMNDYRAALNERDSYDIHSSAWKLGQMKVQSIVAVMVASGNSQMVNEVADEVYNLNDCGTELDDAAVQFDIWLLESNGYGEKAQELRELDWR